MKSSQHETIKRKRMYLDWYQLDILRKIIVDAVEKRLLK